MNTVPELGLHFIVGVGGTALTDAERTFLRALRPAGIILFRHNFSADDLVGKSRALIDEARDVTKRDDLLVSIDHEGGRVHRLYPPVTCFPAAETWREKSPAVATAMGNELRALGVNLSFAPVLDTHSAPENTVIGPRAFASDPNVVAELGVQFFKALEKTGVLSCGKHFPGHGGTRGDSHFELPVLDVDKKTLLERDLVPFHRAIQSGIQALMSAHIIVPAIDENLPASVSKNVLESLLRGELGFTGTLITDALEMRALQHLSLGEKAALALGATTDILLIGQHYGVSPLEQAGEMKNGITRAISSGTLSMKTLESSVARTQKLIGHLKSLQSAAGPVSADVIGCAAHQTLASQLQPGVTKV